MVIREKKSFLPVCRIVVEIICDSFPCTKIPIFKPLQLSLYSLLSELCIEKHHMLLSMYAYKREVGRGARGAWECWRYENHP